MVRKAFPLVILDQIEWIDTASQLRIDRRQDKVDEWVEILKELDAHAIDTAKRLAGPPMFDHPFPPIVLFTDGGINSQHFIGDGYHRFHSYRQAGREAIPADVTVCDDPRFEAFKYALSANATHGIPRTSADKRNAVRQALACQAFAKLSLRELAKLCDVSMSLVKTLKDELNPDKPKIATETLGVFKNTNEQKVADVSPESQDRPTTRVSTPRDHDPPRITDATIPLEADQPTGPQDKLKREVPSGLIPHWEFGRKALDLKRRISAIVTEIEGFVTPEGPPPGSEHLHVQTVFTHLKSAMDELGNAAYHTECPECDAGKVKGAKCKVCLGAGFLTASMYERLPPKSKEKLSA